MERLKLRPEVKAFAEAMERTLRENDHKGGWRYCELDYFMSRLGEERMELSRAMRPIFKTLDKNDEIYPEEIEPAQHEAVDIANYCMMLWDNLSRAADKGGEE